ncbi:unnamed protein product, partial [Rotaria sp. Silwood1]
MTNQSRKNDHSKSNEKKSKLTLTNEPDVFINLAHKIYDESITNHERIAEAITSEIQKIRLHAISTIYICSSRNKTVLNDERLKQIQHHQTDDDDIDFKKIIVKILGTLADRDNIDYKKFFTTCLEHIEKNIIVEDSISYIYQQSTDETRCQELFNENIICRIIGLLENIYLSEQTKLHICMIINNYLEHSSSKALNESQLQIFAHVLNNLPYNFELKLEALRSIILTAVKNRHLPDFIIQTLIKNIDKDDNKLNSLAIIALDIVSQRQIIPNVDKLSTKLLVDWIIVNEGAGITCEKMSSDNVDCQSISSLAAEIFVNTLKNNVMINNRTLEHLTKALNSNHKQTCILSAKALYLASETHELGNDVLIELKEHIENKINDVIVYSTVAYTRGLVKLSSNEGSIMKSHMECLPKIYVFDDLQLDEETFADTVNNNILSVLLNVSKHNLFDDHMFVIFNHILSFESCNQVVAIKILYNYSANKYSIPQDTILALENAIDIPEISHEATKVLSNVIKNRQLINEKFLRHLTDNLYLSNDDQLRKESFELLDIANDNQDISDEFFYILELERAISIINSFSLDRNDAMSYLYEMTEQNQKITLNGFKILDKIMSSQFVFDEKIFGILLNTCKNEQSIPDNLINKLVERFNPRQINCQLIDIFQNLVKNNQNIPTKLLSKLEKALENTLISDQVLSIFVLLALKGQYLSENILTKILDKILVLENSLIIEQYLSVIFSLIQNKDYFKKNFLSSLFTFFTRFSTNDISLVLRIQSVLIHILKGNNQNVIRASLNGLKILVTFHKVKLNQKSTDILLDLAGNTICDETMKNDINVLLNISKLDNSQQCKMKLLRLKYKSNDELLEALAKFSKPKLFQQNFDQLNNIINNSSELNEKVLKILLECSNKDKITDTLLYSIIFLMNSTNSKEMRSLCRDLIIETIRAGKIVSNKIISCIVTQNDVLKLIAKKQPIPEKFQHHLNLFSRIVSIDNIDLKDFSEFLENIRHEFNQDYKLSDLSMSKLLSIQITNNDYDICMKLEQELFHIFVLILKHNPTYSSQLSIVNRLEKAILFENINKNILMTYQEVIKMKQYQTNNLSKILDSLVDLLDSNKFLNVEVELLTCIALISEVMDISKNETLEKYFSNDNDRIRSWSFRGLRVAYDRNDKSKIFEEWCNNIMINLEFHTRVKVVMDLDLFETISTIKYIDFNKIYNKPQNQWNRELLIFDLLERFTLNQIEQFDFYKTWLEIEEYTGFQQDQSDILLKLLHRIQLNNMISFNQCNELIRILKNIDFESIYNILSNSSNPYEDILKKFFKDLIFERLSNKEINKKYIDNLVRKMIIKFSFDISKKLLNTIYGEVAQFQFDTLRTEYSQLNTLGNRKFEVAIVDEVDSMLIDDSSKIARLATIIPGIDQLQLIYYTIWYRLIYLQDRMLEINNKIYLFHGKISFEQEKIILEYIDEQQGNIIKIPDLKIYIESISNISHIGILISENVEVETFIKKDIENYIRDLLNRLTIIPKSFEEFVDTQMCKWIDNAMIALNYQENVHYVVHQGLIKPVDYASTGIVQSFSHWGDGLHQFLQLKHNLRMTSETFTTNFLSNKGFFIKYGSNLFGLTGTLGSEKAKQVLADIYNVNLGIIPSMRQKQYLSLPDLVLTNEVDWLNEICRSAINESRKERGILVICETIEYSTQIVEKLQREYSSGTIKLYTMNTMNQEKHIEKIYPREIIVSTNLAARGNDIKTDNIKKYGGLHVIITFMPPNKRVEEQAFGRTARQGKRGTGQRIINASSLAHYENFNIQKITELRDSIETNILDDFQKRELKIITLKDELFTKFCLLLNEIRQKIRDKSSLYVKVKSQAKKILTKISPSILESNILLSIEEQWAIFLREIDNQISPIDNEIFYERFEKFSKNIRKNYENDCIIKNPYCHIAIANDLVINESSLRRNYDDAMKHFDLAIELDPKHTAAAFAGKGWLTLKGKENFFGSNKQSIGYKEAAIRLFNKALEILSEEISTLTVIQSFLKHRCQNMNTDLSKQLMQKNNILSSYCNSLENAVNIIKKSQRLIQITELIDYSKLRENEINSKFFTKKDSVNFQSEISQKIISYDGIEKGCGKWCDVRLISHNNLNRYKTSIQNGKEIIVMKGIHNTFTVVYKDKIQCRLREWIVEDSTLANVLAALSYDETILDRDIHMKIYTLIYEKLTSKNGHIREEFLVFLQESTDHNQYEVTFNDLTVRQDSKIKDQAIEIIDKILPQDEGSLFDINGEFSFFNKVPNFLKKSGILEHDYEHINITMQQVKAEKLREYLNPNIEVKDLTKEEALTQLKEKNFFFNRYLLPQACFVDLYRINLEIISENNNKLENMADLKATVAIKRIEERIDQNERFNLSFISANKTAKILEKVLYRSNITVEFIDLGVESVREKLRTIVSRSLTLELTNTKETLLEVIRSLTTEQIQLYNRVKEQSIIEVVNRITAEKKILEISNTFATIKLIDINKSIVENVLNICSNANFNITFINIKNSCLLIGLKDELINVKIDMLRKNAAKTIIKRIRKHKLEFSLVFSQLTCNQVKQIIELAPIEQENIEVQQFKTLSELFMSQLRPNVELAEFSGRGIEYLIEINEKKFIPWTSIAIICSLASVQMAVGGLLIASGFGATLGMSLVTEGGA